MKKELHLISTRDLFLKPEPKIVEAKLETVKAKKATTNIKPTPVQALLSKARVSAAIEKAKCQSKFDKIVRESGIIKK